MNKNEVKKRYWRTRKDSFVDVWEDVEIELVNNPYVEAKTILKYLQTRYPNTFPDGQLRTLQRRVKAWRSIICPIEESRSWMLALLQGKIDITTLSRSDVV